MSIVRVHGVGPDPQTLWIGLVLLAAAIGAYVLAPLIVAVWKREHGLRFLAGNVVLAWIGPAAAYIVGTFLLQALNITGTTTTLVLLATGYVIGLGLYTRRFSSSRRRTIFALHVNIVLATILFFSAQGLLEPQPPGPRIERPEMQLNMVDCYTHRGNGNTGTFIMDIENTGETELKTDPANFEVTMPDGNINYSLTKRGISLSPSAVESGATQDVALLRTGGREWPKPGSYAVYQINATSGYKMEPNTPYQIELTFTRQSETVATTCRAKEPADDTGTENGGLLE